MIEKSDSKWISLAAASILGQAPSTNLGIGTKLSCTLSRRNFVCLGSCSNRRIAGYVTVATRAKTDKKASENVQVI